MAKDEIEILAEIEHARGCDQRTRDGWVYDSTLTESDTNLKRTPWLVGWDTLSDSDKRDDREAVTGFPVLLARAGYRLKRINDVRSTDRGE